MSGVKCTTVSIDSRELQRLRDQAAKATNLTQTNAALDRINRALTNSLARANSRIDALTTNMNTMSNNLTAVKAGATKEVNDLRAQLQATIRDSNQRLTDLNNAHKQEMEAMETNFQTALTQTREEMEITLAANNAAINSRIDATNAQVGALAGHVAAIGAAVAAVAGDLETLHVMAEEYFEHAQQLLDDSMQYRCELLLPGQLKPVQTALDTARSQITSAAAKPAGQDKPTYANAPAARLAAQQAFNVALDFHERIIKAEQEWALTHQAAVQAVSQAHDRLQACRQVTHYGTELDVNYWSNGDWAEQNSEAEALLDHLENHADGDTIDQLRSIQATGQYLEEETLDTVTFALCAAENSQSRGCTADTIADALDGASYTVKADDYQGLDQRAAHRIHLLNPVTGLSLVVTQTPRACAQGGLETDLEVQIADPGGCTAADIHLIAAEIQNALQAARVNVGLLANVPGHSDIHSGDPNTANIQNWRVEPVTTATKPQHKPRTVTKPATAIAKPATAAAKPTANK